jgi:membrane protease YdiL (CAAX protease family)
VPLTRTTIAYALLALSAALVGRLAGHQDLLTTEPWLPIAPTYRAGVSVGLGMIVACVTLWLTEVAHRRSWRVRALHESLRPAVHGASDGMLSGMAIASGVGEELFFRGALLPLVGVVGSSAAFGLVHQVRGEGRWVWVAWAAAMGLVLGLIFRGTGHLGGCVVAHVVVNAVNLRRLRNVDPRRVRRTLGGLLVARAGAAPGPVKSRDVNRQGLL